MAAYREAIWLSPDDADAHHKLGVILRDGRHEYDAAAAEFREAIRLQPDHHWSHEDLGGILNHQGKREEAIAEFRTSTRTDALCTRSHNTLAWTLAFPLKRPQREYDEALIHARKAVEIDPGNGSLVNTLMLAEYRASHWAESIAAGERSMALTNGGDANDWFFLAMAHSQKGNKDEARKWFDKSVAWTTEKAPNSAELRQFWTEAAELVGQPGPDTSG